MNEKQKKQAVKQISDSLVFIHSIHINDFTHDVVISIPYKQIPPDGLPEKDLKLLIDTPNFKVMKMGQFNLLFIYDTKNDPS